MNRNPLANNTVDPSVAHMGYLKRKADARFISKYYDTLTLRRQKSKEGKFPPPFDPCPSVKIRGRLLL
jgi:hypothetical protein